MASTTTVDRVLRMAGSPFGVSSSDVQALIDEWLPVIHEEIGTGTSATVSLGVTEVIAGELLASLARAPGAQDSFRVGLLQVSPPRLDLADPSGLIARGWARLEAAPASSSGVLTAETPSEGP